MNPSIEQSFKSQIRKIANARRIDPAQLWQNLILERFLVRLSRSKYVSNFVLKGGVLLTHYVELNRHTQDIDFLVRRLSREISQVKATLSEIIHMPIDDGFQFSHLKVNELPHPHMKYSGTRATLAACFGKTRFQVKIDLGFGDLVDPIKMPIYLLHKGKESLFESEVEITCYPKEFIFAEKLETVVYRGGSNSRMKDFHDLYVLIKSRQLEKSKMKKVIQSVFEHRKTEVELPILFSEKNLNHLQRYWKAHLRGLSREHKMPKEFKDILAEINHWVVKYMDLAKLGYITKTSNQSGHD